MGIELVMDEPSAERIREFFRLRGYTMTENNLKQALKPVEGRVIPNDVGTAPAAAFEKNGKVVITLPGPPNEFTHVLNHEVLPYLKEKGLTSAGLIKSKVLKVVELGESAAEDRIKDLLGSENPTVAPYAHFGEVHFRITAKAEKSEEADRMIAELEAKVRERLGDTIFGADDQTLEQVIVETLTERNLTLALAESCTGGLQSDRITNISGSSAVFMAGIVTYSNEAKIKFLGVPRELIDKHGAVSHEVAKEMASGVRSVVGTNIGMGITGIAGPTGGTPTKPVGLVYIALSAEDTLISEEYRFTGGRTVVKQRAAQAALTMLRRYLLQSSPSK
jgi:nicotinamide-nucleotide amidase